MTKYNIHEKRGRKPGLRRAVNQQLLEKLKTEILNVISLKKKYRVNGYTAMRLAEEIHTNPRYISIVVNACFGKNYTQFVNDFRIEEAKQILQGPDAAKLTMTDISRMVGFGNRQSFYASFFRVTGTTPCDYRKLHAEDKDRT